MSEHDAERLAWRAYHASYALFRQNGVPEAECEDLAHEVVYRLLCHLQRGNPVCDRWIETVARHLLSDYHRKRTQEREALAHCAHERTGGKDEEEWYSLLSLHEVLARLPEDQSALLMAYAEKDTEQLKAFAAREGISLGAVYKRVERLIAHLKRLLGVE